jgi:hypothetical protein
MLKFLQYMFTNYDRYKSQPQYDEDGNYIDPKVQKLKIDELIIPAEKARILHTKSVEDVRKKERKGVFAKIHQAIKQGKKSVRLEAYNTKPELLEYITGLGYTVETVTPPGEEDRFRPSELDDDGIVIPNDGPYRFYRVSGWAPENNTNLLDSGSGM